MMGQDNSEDLALIMSWPRPTGRELIAYAKRHPDRIRLKQRGILIKLNYSQHSQAKKLWNQYTVMARGIIIDTETGKIIAYPFRKFFNLFECEKYDIPLPKVIPYEITKKYDGVLIIPYPDKGRLFLSSRGVFENKYTRKARKVQYFDWLDLAHYTFMFELVSPAFSKFQDKKEGFLVTKYDQEDLILVGMRDRKTTRLLMPSEVITYAQRNDLHAFSLVPLTLSQLQEEMARETREIQEGWVITYTNGFMVKLKRWDYLRYARSITGITKKRILRALSDGRYEVYKEAIPEEMHSDVEKIYEAICQKRDQYVQEVLAAFNAIPEEVRRDPKQFFLALKKYKTENAFHQKDKKFIGALKVYYNTREKKALHQHFYRFVGRKSILKSR